MLIRERFVKLSSEGRKQQWCELECDECHKRFEQRRRGCHLKQSDRKHLCSVECVRTHRAQIALKMTQRWNERSEEEKHNVLIKKRQAYVRRYGVDHPFKSPEVREQIRQTCIKRYGVNNPASSPIIKAKINQSALHAKAHQTRKMSGTYSHSKIEDAFYDALCEKFNHDNVERQVIINGWSIDFYIKSIDTYVQFDGVYWHGLDRPRNVIEKSSSPRDRVILTVLDKDPKQNEWFKIQQKRLCRITDMQFKTNRDIIDIIDQRPKIHEE
jgi:hypothetical protein